jgi:hypothetical protein
MGDWKKDLERKLAAQNELKQNVEKRLRDTNHSLKKNGIKSRYRGNLLQSISASLSATSVKNLVRGHALPTVVV